MSQSSANSEIVAEFQAVYVIHLLACKIVRLKHRQHGRELHTFCDERWVFHLATGTLMYKLNNTSLICLRIYHHFRSRSSDNMAKEMDPRYMGVYSKSLPHVWYCHIDSLSLQVAGKVDDLLFRYAYLTLIPHAEVNCQTENMYLSVFILAAAALLRLWSVMY